jgi:hypothetical protein
VAAKPTVSKVSANPDCIFDISEFATVHDLVPAVANLYFNARTVFQIGRRG